MLKGLVAYSQENEYTGTIESQDTQTITPDDNTHTIPAGVYISGVQTVNPVSVDTTYGTSNPIKSNNTYSAATGKYFKSVVVSFDTYSDLS